MTPWHFTPHPADLPIEQFREQFYHPDMPEKMEMIRGRLFWSDTQRLHVLGILIESLGTDAVERFIQQHRADPNPAAGGPAALPSETSPDIRPPAKHRIPVQPSSSS